MTRAKFMTVLFVLSILATITCAILGLIGIEKAYSMATVFGFATVFFGWNVYDHLKR